MRVLTLKHGLLTLALSPIGIVFGCGSALPPKPKLGPDTGMKCKLQKSPSKPYVIEWPGADRQSLESKVKKGVEGRGGLVAVRYKDCEMEILRACQVKGGYNYEALTPNGDSITIRNESELYASIPMYAAKFEARLREAGQLTIAQYTVGRFEADKFSFKEVDLEGECDDATHVIHSMSVGAFRFFTGSEAAASGGIDVLGASAGASAGSQHLLLTEAGSEEACAEAGPQDQIPPYGCGALIRIELAKVARPEENKSTNRRNPNTPNPTPMQPVNMDVFYDTDRFIPGSIDWEDRWYELLLKAYDRNNSDMLEANEIAPIGCELIDLMDDQIYAEMQVPAYVIYGFGPAYEYVGDILGFDNDARAPMFDLFLRCGHVEDYDNPSMGGGKPSSGGGGNVASAIRGIPEPATSGWDAAVEKLMLQNYDANKSGRIDSRAELDMIPCTVFDELDLAVYAAEQTPLFALYGFGEGYGWIGDALGFDVALRWDALDAMDRCGLVD